MIEAGAPTLDNKEVIISKAIPYKDKMKTNRLFVGGIREPLTEDHLREYFSEIGNVQSIKLIPENKNERKKGFAFIEFDSVEAVEQAVDKKNPPRGQRHDINGVRVDCQKTYPEEHPAYKKIKKIKDDMKYNRMGYHGDYYGDYHYHGGYGGGGGGGGGYGGYGQGAYGGGGGYDYGYYPDSYYYNPGHYNRGRYGGGRGGSGGGGRGGGRGGSGYGRGGQY